MAEFKDLNGCMITEGVPGSHQSLAQHRILYVGGDILLPKRLADALGCHVVRSPGGYPAHLFISGDTKYSLFLFDEERAEELEGFARSLKHRELTSVVVVRTSERFETLADTIGRALGV